MPARNEGIRLLNEVLKYLAEEKANRKPAFFNMQIDFSRTKTEDYPSSQPAPTEFPSIGLNFADSSIHELFINVIFTNVERSAVKLTKAIWFRYFTAIRDALVQPVAKTSAPNLDQIAKLSILFNVSRCDDKSIYKFLCEVEQSEAAPQSTASPGILNSFVRSKVVTAAFCRAYGGDLSSSYQIPPRIIFMNGFSPGLYGFVGFNNYVILSSRILTLLQESAQSFEILMFLNTVGHEILHGLLRTSTRSPHIKLVLPLSAVTDLGLSQVKDSKRRCGETC